MNMSSDLSGRAAGVRTSFLAMKDAQDLQSAGAALQDLAAKLEAAATAVSTGFQALAATDSAQASGNMLGSNAPGTGTSSDPGAPAPASASPANSAADKVADEVKKKLKKFLPF